jgi:hypothetical protein
MQQNTDVRKWMLGAVATALVCVVAILAYFSLHTTVPAEKTYTLSPQYVAHNIVDLSRRPDASFLQLMETDHVRVEDEQDGISLVEVLEGEHRGERGWVRTAWLQVGR